MKFSPYFLVKKNAARASQGIKIYTYTITHTQLYLYTYNYNFK